MVCYFTKNKKWNKIFFKNEMFLLLILKYHEHFLASNLIINNDNFIDDATAAYVIW